MGQVSIFCMEKDIASTCLCTLFSPCFCPHPPSRSWFHKSNHSDIYPCISSRFAFSDIEVAGSQMPTHIWTWCLIILFVCSHDSSTKYILPEALRLSAVIRIPVYTTSMLYTFLHVHLSFFPLAFNTVSSTAKKVFRLVRSRRAFEICHCISVLSLYKSLYVSVVLFCLFRLRAYIGACIITQRELSSSYINMDSRKIDTCTALI